MSAPFPRQFTPQLALLVKDIPNGPQWLHEIKYDGYRIGCFIKRGRVTLLSRNGKDWTDRFPSVREAAARLEATAAVLDGEVTRLDASGRSDFQALQNAFSNSADAERIVYFAFDLLHLDGVDFSREPLEVRKARLAALLDGSTSGVIRRADHLEGDGPAILAEACRLGLEGIVSKRRDLPYHPGRHGEWVKTKCVNRQEFVIGGFTDPEGARQGIGALLVGYYDEQGRLAFGGKVGTGFTQQSARELRRRLEAIEQKRSPFDTGPAGWLDRHAHWVRPILVADVTFTEWTADNRIRHPSFQGLREDRRPEDVRRDRAATLAPTTGDRPAGSRVMSRGRAEVRRAPRQRVTPAPARGAGDTVFAGVRLTHPDRVLFPEAGATKLDLARYYEDIADWFLPHVADRPLTLVRCPGPVGDDCFYMKHSNVWAPASLRRVRIREKRKVGEYLIADTLPAVVGLVQMGVTEIHTWNARYTDLERPDRLVFDIDPGPDVEWRLVVDAARLVRAVLRRLDLVSFVKTTGGRGLHVVVPIEPELDWDGGLQASRAIAEAVVSTDPTRYTTRFAKAGREDKILIDYLRNNRANTSIAAYSTRANARATVSVPLRWEELGPRVRPAAFTIETVPQRLRRLRADPWAEYWIVRQRLPRSVVGRRDTA